MLDYTGLKLLYYHETIHVTIFADSYLVIINGINYGVILLFKQAMAFLCSHSECPMYTNDMPQFATYP